MSLLGRRLRDERERLGLTQDQFGGIGGVQKRAQVRYESGGRMPDADYLLRLAESADPEIDVQYILTGVRWGPYGPQDAELAALPMDERAREGIGRMLEVFDRLPQADREMIGKDAAKALMGYVVDQCPTREGLWAFVQAALEVWKAGRPATPVVRLTADELDLVEMYRTLDEGGRKRARAEMRARAEATVRRGRSPGVRVRSETAKSEGG